jgi:hypothetical protein
VAAALVAGLVVVAANAVPAVATTVRESCGLLRTREVTRALEQPSAGPARGAAPLVCDWTLQPTDTRPAGAVSVYLRRGDDARDAFTLAKKFFTQDGAVVRVPQLGARAFYVPVAGVVYVLEDSDTLLSLQGVYPTGSAVDAAGLQQALTALAAAAARRL